MQNYNSELVRCIEELREKREELNKSIAADEEEKGSCARDCAHLEPPCLACADHVCLGCLPPSQQRSKTTFAS